MTDPTTPSPDTTTTAEGQAKPHLATPITDYLAAVRARIPAAEWQSFTAAVVAGSKLAHERLVGKQTPTKDWEAKMATLTPQLREEVCGLVGGIIEQTVTERMAFLRSQL